MIPLTDEQQFFLSYVSDQLPPDKRSEADEKLITDQDFSDAFQEARHDLIDAYAAEELPADARRQVELAILSNRDGQVALSMARTMKRSKTRSYIRNDISQQEPNQNEATLRIRQYKTRMGLFVSALAACFLLAFLFIHIRQRSMHHQTAKTSPGSALADKAGATGTGRQRSTNLDTFLNQSSSRSHSALRHTDVLAIAMPMETLRGDQSIAIPLRPGIDRIHVQWPIPSGVKASVYTLEIASKQSVSDAFPQHGPLDRIGNIRVANFFIPTDTLPTGQVLFRLRTADASGSTPIADSSVRISR